MDHFDNYGTNYYGIDLSKYIIEAKSGLEAIVIMKDCINENARMSKTSDAYDDEEFIDIVLLFLNMKKFTRLLIVMLRYVLQMMNYV